MILLDLDDFKLLNDRYGDAAGEETLVTIAGRLNELAGKSDGDRMLFFRAADRALYRAKAVGKNCVVAAAPGASYRT